MPHQRSEAPLARHRRWYGNEIEDFPHLPPSSISTAALRDSRRLWYWSVAAAAVLLSVVAIVAEWNRSSRPKRCRRRVRASRLPLPDGSPAFDRWLWFQSGRVAGRTVSMLPSSESKGRLVDCICERCRIEKRRVIPGEAKAPPAHSSRRHASGWRCLQPAAHESADPRRCSDGTTVTRLHPEAGSGETTERSSYSPTARG
jgi:hypothetical protein